jgi:hypothetical protein
MTVRQVGSASKKQVFAKGVAALRFRKTALNEPFYAD